MSFDKNIKISHNFSQVLSPNYCSCTQMVTGNLLRLLTQVLIPRWIKHSIFCLPCHAGNFHLGHSKKTEISSAQTVYPCFTSHEGQGRKHILKNKREFPAVTFCFSSRIKPAKAHYIVSWDQEAEASSEPRPLPFPTLHISVQTLPIFCQAIVRTVPQSYIYYIHVKLWANNKSKGKILQNQ